MNYGYRDPKSCVQHLIHYYPAAWEYLDQSFMEEV